MPRKAKVKETIKVLPLPAGVEIGGLVRYYYEGWRTGTLEEVSGNDAGVRPCGPRKHLTWINVTELSSIGDK